MAWLTVFESRDRKVSALLIHTMGKEDNMDRTAILVVQCPDRKGLVAVLSNLLYQHGANILEVEQYTNTQAKMFFQRIKFDLTELDISHRALTELLTIECGRFDMQWQLTFGALRKRIAIFVSKLTHCFYDLILRHRLGELPCDIALVVSNHEDMAYLADHVGTPFYFINRGEDVRLREEIELARHLTDMKVDLIVLARFMQILGEDFVKLFEKRIINIHHSFLPAFVGARPYHQAYERGIKLIGATAHYVTVNLDEGPIIAQDVVHTSHRDSISDMARKGRDIERVVLARAVLAHLEDRIIVWGNRTVVFE